MMFIGQVPAGARMPVPGWDRLRQDFGILF
jgi:hypothetical protein